MATSYHGPSGRLLAALALGMLLIGGAMPGVPRVQARQGAASCAALGTYVVGVAVPPATQGGTQQGSGASGNDAKPAPGSGGAAIAIPRLLGGLTGTLTLTAYTGCGVPTAGSFAVQNVMRAPPMPQPQRPGGSAGRSVTVPILPIFGTGVLTTTGTIAQDPLHAGDPSYVAVTAMVVYGRYRYGCSTICQPAGGGERDCPDTGCMGTMIVSRTAHFGSVTGFLRIQPGTRQYAGLAFLPPPDPAAASAAAAMQVQPIAFTGVRTGP